MRNRAIKFSTPQAGFTLIEVLVVLAIMSITLMAFATMMNVQVREARAANEKMAVLDLRNSLNQSLSDGEVCEYLMKNPVQPFNAAAISPTTPHVITPRLPIYSSVVTVPSLVLGPVAAAVGTQASPYSNSVWIKSIVLSIGGAPTPLVAGTNIPFTATWIVSFDSNKLVRAIAPITVTTNLTVDTTTIGASKIVSCKSPTAPKVCTQYYTKSVSGGMTYFSGRAQAMCDPGDTYVSGAPGGCDSSTGPIGSMTGHVLEVAGVDVGYKTVCYVGGWTPYSWGYVRATAQVTCCK